MGRTLKNDYNQYIAPSTSRTLHSVAGWVRSITVTGTSTSPGLLTLYDNTAASGNKLIEVRVSTYAPVVIHFPLQTPLRFATGLTAVSDSACLAYILTEV